MKHKIKVFSFLLFIICTLAFGVREVNYNNYQILKNGTKEVIYIIPENNQTHIQVFGEEFIIPEEINRKIQNFINKFTN